MISRGHPFGLPFPDCQNTTSQCSLEQKINVKTFLEKFLVQIDFQCCLLLKIAIFNSRIWNFPKSGFAYRFQIKLDFFLKRIRHYFFFQWKLRCWIFQIWKRRVKRGASGCSIFSWNIENFWKCLVLIHSLWVK